jgi:hypothetical protein
MTKWPTEVYSPMQTLSVIVAFVLIGGMAASVITAMIRKH